VGQETVCLLRNKNLLRVRPDLLQEEEQWIIFIEGDQKVSMHLMITIQKVGAQRLFDHPV